jgi:hypothetical protein
MKPATDDKLKVLIFFTGFLALASFIAQKPRQPAETSP